MNTTDDGQIVVTNDPINGLSYIYLAGPIPPGGARHQLVASSDIILDFDAEGHLIGVELLDQKLLHPALAAKSVRPGSLSLRSRLAARGIRHDAQ